MSWDAMLSVRGTNEWHEMGSWNYTHNTSKMIYAVITPADQTRATAHRRAEIASYDLSPWRDDYLAKIDGGEWAGSWYDALDGLSGSDGADYLDRLIAALAADPERFRAMNPENGWGNYDGLLRILTEMRDAGREFPAGKWWCSG